MNDAPLTLSTKFYGVTFKKEIGSGKSNKLPITTITNKLFLTREAAVGAMLDEIVTWPNNYQFDDNSNLIEKSHVGATFDFDSPIYCYNWDNDGIFIKLEEITLFELLNRTYTPK